jgi:hypothetical protein
VRAPAIPATVGYPRAVMNGLRTLQRRAPGDSATDRIKRTGWAIRSAVSLAPRLRLLPSSVRLFYLRAWTAAVLLGDASAFIASASPAEVADLLRLGAKRSNWVELGTANGWTAIIFALAEPGRQVITYDPYPEAHPRRETYLRLIPQAVRNRIELRPRPGADGPKPSDPPVQMLFVDSSHQQTETVESFRVWLPALSADAIVAFHDYKNPVYPGVSAAVDELGLSGETLHSMFIWRRSANAAAPG